MYRFVLALTYLVIASSALAVSPHYQHSTELGGEASKDNFPRPGLLPDVTPGPEQEVYGYLAYWDDDLNVVPWDDLSAIALFSANSDESGNLTNTSRWDLAEEAVAIAQAYDVRVHLCVTNFSSASLESFLKSSSARQTLINNLESWVSATGADGVNIDFEGLPFSVKSEMVQFTKDLEAAVGEVVLATPAVDWDGAWDFDELNLYADMFIMGYDYHWSGSDEAGPVDPLYGGGPWGQYAIDWTIADYLQWGANPNRVILGLPLYGKRWSVSANSVPAAATADGTNCIYSDCQSSATLHGELWESSSETPYWYDGSGQGWYSNQESLQLRIQYAKAQGLAGIGFWALNYDDQDADLWSMIRSETTVQSSNEGPDDTGTVILGDTLAEAGLPLLAYVKDIVGLNGTASIAADGGELSYSWTQLEGEAVTMADADSASPSFSVEGTGTHVFELEVTDSEGGISVDKAYVIVIDPAAGRTYGSGCGCQVASGWGLTWLMLLSVAGLVSRRRGEA